jgi:2-keto-4-pentenoate hydratase/2-oxohepta-3-ene-1,7-dioic acid hydratase in catechol pathway
MKLITFELDTGYQKIRRIGAICSSRIVDLNQAYLEMLKRDEDPDFALKFADLIFPSDMILFFQSGIRGLEAAKEVLAQLEKDPNAFSDCGKQIVFNKQEVRILPPVPRPSTIRDFSTFEDNQKTVTMKKTGSVIPDVWYRMPVYWKANPENTIGPEDDIYWPVYTEKLDFELEFGVYISKQGKNIPVEEAGDYIAGYTIFNDISARDQQESEMVMTFGPSKGKDFDHSKIFGPCLVTPDEFGDKGHLMQARINGEVWSESSTDEMYWTFPQMIAYISQSETLYPGDFLGSGTCPTGCGIELNRWLKPDDVIELEVEGIGVLRNRVIRKEG